MPIKIILLLGIIFLVFMGNNIFGNDTENKGTPNKATVTKNTDDKSYQNSNIIVYFNNNIITYSSQKPVVIDGVTYVPLKDFITAMGGSISGNSTIKLFTVKKDKTVIKITLNNRNAFKGQKLVRLEGPAKLIDATLMVPLKFACEMFDYKVNYDLQDTENKIFITSNP